ncbi:MAG: carbohydrate ABC transporter permease [Firmicutes bacterium]|nr:carbohydrate ABC transporter permease [Bacillota bacterium]
MRRTNVDFIVDAIIAVVVGLIAWIMLYPFLNVVAVAFSDYSEYLKRPLMIWPRNINFEAFEYVFSNPLILNCYKNTVIITALGTIGGLFLTVVTAYPLSKRHLKGQKFVMMFIVFTMLFNGGLIPKFYLIKSLGMLDTLWALIIPGMLTSFNIILMKNFFEGLPKGLEEAAKIDGAKDIYILYKIIIPLSMPIIATIALFIAVSYWNSFFNAVVYIRSTSKWTLQLLLREIIMTSNAALLQGTNFAEEKLIQTQSVKYATLIVVILPILCLYPFLQKYFVKGVTLGAVKG